MKPLVLYIFDVIGKLIMEGKTCFTIIISESISKDLFTIKIEENSPGQGQRKGCCKIDLPLFRYQTEITGGSLENKTGGNYPASLTAMFNLSHPRRQPLGDMAGMLTIIMAAHPEVDFTYTHATDKGIYRFSTNEARKIHKVETLKEARLLKIIGLSINKNLKDIETADLRA